MKKIDAKDFGEIEKTNILVSHVGGRGMVEERTIQVIRAVLHTGGNNKRRVRTHTTKSAFPNQRVIQNERKPHQRHRMILPKS